MQERGRKSGGRNSRSSGRGSSSRSHSSSRGSGRSSRSSSKRSKSKPRNYAEQRNQLIEENKKKSLKVIAQKKKPSTSTKSTPKINKVSEPIVKPSSKLNLRSGSRSGSKSNVVGLPKSSNLLPQVSEVKPQCLNFAIALLVAVGLLLISSYDLLLSEGLFFIYLGIILFKKPILHSRGPYLDWIVFGVIVYTAGACFLKLPFFNFEWRTIALQEYGLNFGLFNSINPSVSFEAWLRIVACMVLFYHIGQWRMNDPGRIRFFYCVIGSAILLILAQPLWNRSLLKLLVSIRNSFTPIQDYGDNLSLFLLIGAVVAWGLFFDSYTNRHKKLLASFSFTGLVIILAFLIKQEALFSLLLFFFVAYGLLIRLYIKRSSGLLNYGISALPGLFFSLWIFQNPKVLQFLSEAFVEPLSAQFFALKQLASAQLGSFAFFGNGIATANTLLPQFLETHLYERALSNRNFDLLYYLNDFGLLGFSILLIGLFYWIWKYLLKVRGSQKGLAFVSSLVTLIFLLVFFYGKLSISLGLILLMFIFYDLSLRTKGTDRSSRDQLWGKKVCRPFGFLSLFWGISILCISLFNIPIHSEVRNRMGMGMEKDHRAIREAILYQGFSPDPSYLYPSDPNTHVLAALQAIRSGKPASEVKLALQRSSFLNPNLNNQLLDWGYLLEAYDLSTAKEMWYAYFVENPQGRLPRYLELLGYADSNYKLLLNLKPIAQISPEYSAAYLKFLNKTDFQRLFEYDLKIDFLSLDQESRFQFMERFLEYGMFEFFDSYKVQYQMYITDFFVLESIREKELANFDRALEIFRNNISLKPFDHFVAKADKKYIPRVFLKNYPDLEMGTILVQRAVEAEAYNEALQYVDHLLTLEKPPLYAFSWRAELLYLTDNTVDSWFAYRTYIDAAKVRHLYNQSHNDY